MRKSFVTLFSLLVLSVMLTAAIVPAQAGGNDHQDAGWFHKWTHGGTECKEKYFKHYPEEGEGWEPGHCPAPTPDPTDEVEPTPEATDEPGNGNNGNGGAPASDPVLPPFIQISVWPDMYQMSAHVVGFA